MTFPTPKIAEKLGRAIKKKTGKDALKSLVGFPDNAFAGSILSIIPFENTTFRFIYRNQDPEYSQEVDFDLPEKVSENDWDHLFEGIVNAVFDGNKMKLVECRMMRVPKEQRGRIVFYWI